MNETDQVVLDAALLVPLTTDAFRQERIAYWRREARLCLQAGDMGLARLCEGFATSWEWGTEP